MSSTPADGGDSERLLSVRLLSPAPDLANLPAISGLLPLTTVGALKSRVRHLLAAHGHSSIGLRLIYLGRVLESDTRTLRDVFGEASIQESTDFILHLVLYDYNRISSAAPIVPPTPAAPAALAAPAAPAAPAVPAAPVAPAATQAFASAPRVFRVTHQMTWTNTTTANRPITGTGTADQGGSSLNNTTAAPEFRLAGHLQERHSDVHTTYNSRAESLAPQRALTPAEVERIIAVADATRNLHTAESWIAQRMNDREITGRLAHQAATGASTRSTTNTNTTNTTGSSSDSGTSSENSHAAAGRASRLTTSWEPEPSQRTDVYILASPTGPRGLLINGGAEAYYTPPVASVDAVRTTRSAASSTGVASVPVAATAEAAGADRLPVASEVIEQQRNLLLQRAHMLAQRRLQQQLHQQYLQQWQQQQQSRLHQMNVQQQILQQHQYYSQHQRTLDEHLAIHNRLHREFQQRVLQDPELARHFQQLHQQAALSGQQQQQPGLAFHGSNTPIAPQVPATVPAVAGAGVPLQPQERQPHQEQGQQPHLQQAPQVRIHIRANNPGAGLLAAMWPHIWLMARLMLFVWWFTSPDASWSRWALVLLMATGVFVMNTGLLDGIANEAWAPVREHLDRILRFEDPALVAAQRGETAAVANMDVSAETAGRPGAGRVGDRQQREPDPAEVAERLLAQRRNANTERLVDFARHLERMGIMFLASIAPGFAERHVAQVEAAERVAREERARQRQQQEEEAVAAAAAAEAEAAAAAAAAAAELATVETTAEADGNNQSVGADTAGEKRPVEEKSEADVTEASDAEKAAMAAALGVDGQGRQGGTEG